MAKKPDRSVAVTRTAILVLGMHRSGTSALTRLVNFLGAALPQHLIPASKSNPRGQWESKPLVALQDELLAGLDSSWDDWRAPPPRWRESDVAAGFAGRIRLAIDEEYGNAPMFVLKDPHVCRTLPYWMSILEKSGIRSAPLIIIRNPLEVAESLRERDGISFEKAMLLWLRHYLDVEYETRHLQRNIVTFDALLEDWKLLAVQSASRLGVTWTRQPPMQDVREFLDNELHNHRSTQAELEAHTEVPYWVKAAYRALALLCDEPKSADPKRELDKVRQAFAESAKIFGGVAFAQTDELKQAAIEVAAANLRGNAAEALRTELARVSAERTALTARLPALERDLTQATARANQFERVSHDFETALNQVRAEAKELAVASDDYQRRAEENERRAAGLTKEVEILRRVTADAAELKALAKHLSERTEWIEKELKTQHAKSEKMKGDLQDAHAKTISLSTELQAALAGSMAAAKEAHAHETRATKAQTEARQHQEALAAARARISELQADEQRAQAEISELRAELAESWAISDEIDRAAAKPSLHIVETASAPEAQKPADVQVAAAAPREADTRVHRIEEDLRFERMHVKQLEHRLTTWMGLASAALRKFTRLGRQSGTKRNPPRNRLAAPSASRT
ncbi:MAG: hypothetical protein K8S25_09255 [Alphaproteobacteria bacterium]|nr:hypothetical protein [Alphaproteobacteria bacterium]